MVNFCEGCESLQQLAGEDLPVSPPSAGRSGGGRVGKPQISPVYSLGVSGWPVGGAMEELARRIRRFVVADLLSGGGALRSSASDLPPPPCSQLCRVVLRGFPVPETVERRLRLVKTLKVKVMLSRSRVLTATRQGGGSAELRTIDFPPARGLRPIQGCRGGAAAARRRHVFFVSMVFRSEERRVGKECRL